VKGRISSVLRMVLAGELFSAGLTMKKRFGRKGGHVARMVDEQAQVRRVGRLFCGNAFKRSASKGSSEGCVLAGRLLAVCQLLEPVKIFQKWYGGKA
jgi:hypothetical protein